MSAGSAPPVLKNPARHPAFRGSLLVVGILLIAANLRAPITGVGPLIGTIRGSTGISSTVAGVLTALPVFAFAAASPVAPTIAARLGIERTLFAALLVLGSGTLIRSLPTTGTLFAGTLLLGVAIAMANVLLPSLIKRDFPDRVGVMTSAYVAMMNIAAAVSSGIAVPVADAAPGGWRTAIGCWTGLLLIAAVVWTPTLKARTLPASGTTAAAMPLKSPLAWSVTLFMGLQSFAFYAMISWLPTILHSHGVGKGAAGWELFLFQFIALASNFSTPLLIRRLPDQRWLAAGWSLVAVTGFVGLLALPDLSVLWVSLAGLAGGGSLVLALSFFSLRASDAHQAAALSGMAQAVGYLLAGFGPVLFGGLHDVSGHWEVPLALVIGLSCVQTVMGYRAGRNGTLPS
ncbi:MAG TPA: MFS transporter [Mycobacteriales bacterium]|nr:MFS transporter [Mycobacteriales bacterium]